MAKRGSIKKLKPRETARWQARISALFEADRKNAEAILLENGFDAERAVKAVKEVRAFGTVLQLHNNAPHEFQDPNNPCFFALRLMVLGQFMREAEPASVQVGMLWGRFKIGMGLPAISTAVRGGHLAQHRGPGGSTQGDLALTLGVLVSENPEIKRVELLAYLQSEAAHDRFHSTENRSLFITGIEIDETNRLISYEDRTRSTHKITFDSLERKLRSVKKVPKI